MIDYILINIVLTLICIVIELVNLFYTCKMRRLAFKPEPPKTGMEVAGKIIVVPPPVDDSESYETDEDDDKVLERN